MAKPQFSKFAEERVGSFHQGLALIEANVSKQAWDLMDAPEKLNELALSDEEKFQLMLETNAVFHERIHYLDTFGTIAGASCLAARFQLLNEFMKVAVLLKRDDLRWRLPLQDWIEESDVPPYVNHLAHFAVSHGKSMKIFMAAIEPITGEGHRAEFCVLLPFEVPGELHPTTRHIPAFPQSIGVRKVDEKRIERQITVFHPLGCEAILEGRAHSMARSFLESWFPDYPSELLVSYGPPKRLPTVESAAELGPEIAQAFDIYPVTDLMVSKYLRGKGTHQFQRDLILQLSDLALSKSLFIVRQDEEGTVTVDFKDAGTSLVSEVMNMPQISEFPWNHPEETNAAYRDLLARFREGGTWEEVGDFFPYNSVDIWQSFVAQEITVPLLEERLRTNHAVYIRGMDLMQFALNAKLPRVEVVNDQLICHDMPKPVQVAWAAQLIAGAIADQIFAGATTIRCPRAHGLLPGMKTADFGEGKCADSIRLGCGSCTDGVASREVNCMFNQALQAYSLV